MLEIKKETKPSIATLNRDNVRRVFPEELQQYCAAGDPIRKMFKENFDISKIPGHKIIEWVAALATKEKVVAAMVVHQCFSVSSNGYGNRILIIDSERIVVPGNLRLVGNTPINKNYIVVKPEVLEEILGREKEKKAA